MTMVLLFLMQLAWAASYLIQKKALATMPVGLILVFRYGFACFAFLLAGQYKLSTKFTKREWLLMIVTGVLIFSGSPYFQLNALSHTYATDTAVMTSFEPLIAASLAAIFLKEHIGWKTLATFLVATSGMILMSGWQGDWASLHTERILGDLFFFGSLIVEAFGSTASRYLVQKRSPFQLMAWMMLVGFLVNLMGYWPLLTKTNLEVISAESWLSTLYLALVCSALAYSAWTWLLKKIPLSQLALSIFLQPILGTILAHFIINEPLEWRTLVGGGLVLSSLLLWLASRLSREIPVKKSFASANIS